MVQRLTYRKRHSYATKSNQHRVVKTPGGKLVYQSTKKRASGPKCPVTGKRIQGDYINTTHQHIGGLSVRTTFKNATQIPNFSASFTSTPKL
ncbi:unnamed protein product [Ilex paraguariensis]|uniref:60S ribosomal protein L34 n=1 Tax=Ilex paraguariensis TaxID=185542 RepID=A0ABC8TRQ3_9AQUA